MNHPLFNGMALTCLACVFPSIAQAQICGPAMNCTITRPRPVVTTQYAPQQVTTFCDTTETQMTQRQVVENVPITTCKNVTTDEGCYQQVWVPKPVTRQVSQTIMQQRVKTVAVPVQVVKRVPQISTQMVPVQTVQYVNETVPVGMPVQMTAMASTCSTCGNGPMLGSPSFLPQTGSFTSQMSPVPSRYQPAPYSSAGIPTMPAITVPSNQSAGIPIPGSTFPSASPSGSNNYEETVPARGVPSPRDESIAPPRKTSKFSGVPSAASVWQRQNSSLR